MGRIPTASPEEILEGSHQYQLEVLLEEFIIIIPKGIFRIPAGILIGILKGIQKKISDENSKE